MNQAELIQELARVERSLGAAAKAREGDLFTRTQHDSWSFGEIVVHLTTVTNSYQSVMNEVLNGTHREPKLKYVVGYPQLIGWLLKKSIAPESTRPTKTFPLWEPSAHPHDMVMADFSKSQEELVGWITNIPREKWKTVICSPASANVTYTLSTAFDVLVLHQLRHLGQALQKS